VAPAFAGERWKVLIVGESGTDSLSPAHPAWGRVDEAIAEQLTTAGFSTYDKAALGLTIECAKPPCGNRPVADYVRWAREQPGGIDLLVIYSITATERRLPATRQWQVRVPGRMVDVATAEVVDQWRGGENDFNDEPGGCAEACMSDWLARRLADTGSTVGAVLAEKLGAYRREFVYQALISQLALAEFDRLETALRSAPGYAGGHLKMLQVKDMHREWLHTRASRIYEFRTPLGAGQLNVLLNGVLEDAGIDASVRYAGREFDVSRQGIPYLWRYFFVTLILLLTALAVWVAHSYRRHEIALTGATSPRDALTYLDRVSKRGFPWLPTWHRRADIWRERVCKADAALSRARRFASEEDFDQADLALAEAEALEPNLPEVKLQAEQLQRQRRAAELFAHARSLQSSEPAAAARALAEAMTLDPARKPVLQALMQTLQDVLRRGEVQQAEQQAQTALTQGHPYAALRAVGLAIAAIRGLDGMAVEIASLRRLAEQARATITPLKGPVRGTGLLQRLRLMVGDVVQVGRGSVADVGAIGVGYKRASRIGKQTRLLRDRNGMQIEDVGSTNGTEFDGQVLAAHKPVRLHGGHEVALGGNRESGAAGACRLRLRIPREAAGSAVLVCDAASLRMLDPTQLAEAWPTQTEDLSAVWVALADPVPLALGEALLPADDGQAAVIVLGYDDGYYLAPIDDGRPSGVRIDGEPVTMHTPISPDAQLSANGRAFGLVAW
jgi:hypothetical protein